MAVVEPVGSHDFNIMTNNTFRVKVGSSGDVVVQGSYVWSTGGQGGSTDNVEVLRLGKIVDSPTVGNKILGDNLDLIEYNMLEYGINIDLQNSRR